MASVRSIDSALSITLNTNGRVLRNLIHGADTVMSHILHFYHLAAADFVDVSALGSPWDDGSGGAAFGSLSACYLVPLTLTNGYNGGVTKELVESYVFALNMRKEAHTMGAIFSGRQPHSNAIVPGGVTTLFTASDISNFRGRLTAIRNFINKYYIPDVVFVATRSGLPNDNWTKYWGVGTSPGTALSYGEYPTVGDPFDSITNNANMFLSRGLAHYTTTTPTYEAFNISKIKEYVDYSFYTSPTALPPASGVTTPMAGATLTSAMSAGPQYSWLKAPRYNGEPAEVGPLPRMLVTYLTTQSKSATETGTDKLQNYIGGNIALGAGGEYTVKQLVENTLTAATTVAGTPVVARNLFSPLGRHACRALECKFIADKMDTWLNELTLQHLTGMTSIPYNAGANYTTSVATGSGYVYKEIPKAISSGAGLAEAPRGALGHWITIQSKKIASYQCVVPSTWNAGPRSSSTKRGPAESVLIGLNPAATGCVNDAICNIARMLHPYDFCIACAVHVVTPDGKDLAKFDMGLDGKLKKH